MKVVIIFALVVGIAVNSPLAVGITDIYPIPGVERVVKMRCCECYIYRRDGTRFFEGKREMGFCQSIGGKCEGEVPCEQ